MTDFLEALERAATEPAEPKLAAHPTPWDEVLDTFVDFLNRRYGDAMRALRRDGAAPGVVQLVVNPRGRRNHRTTLLVLHFTRSAVRVLGENSYEIDSAEALQQRLTEMVRTSVFRDTVEEMRSLSQQPVTGVLHAGGLLDRRPSTDVLVTLSADEQARLAVASEATPRALITLRAQLVGPAPAGQGKYTPQTPLRWLMAAGYGLALLEEGGHAPEGGSVVRLSGTPVDPDELS